MNELLTRRHALKSTLGMLATPALPAAAALSSKPELRAALSTYIDAYRAFFSVPPSALEALDEDTSEGQGAYQAALERCRLWRRARREVAKLVLQANGYDLGGKTPATIAAAMVDLGDAVLVVSRDSTYEGVEGDSDAMDCLNVCVAPRSPAMRAALESLPAWANDEVADNSWHSPTFYASFLADYPGYRPNHEDDLG